MTTVEQLIQRSAALLDSAEVCFGHGSDNAYDEAAELVFYSLGFAHQDAAKVYPRTVTLADEEKTQALIQRRIQERVPAAYLTNRMWFCGHEFYVDQRVLVPRSPIAELIERQFAPWIDPNLVENILDIGTGSGCIAIASALELRVAQVDAADLSEDALAVTRINIKRYALESRVRAVRADVFSGLPPKKYDVIVSNPPYVGAAEVAALPPEYAHEPQIGLLAGDDGLTIVRRILHDAEAYLSPHGILIVEVGNTEFALADAFPSVPFTWLEFERGGGGVFLLSASQLAECRDHV